MTKRRGPTPPKAWQPMRRGVVVSKARSREAFRAITGQEMDESEYVKEVWLNDKYVVTVDRRDDKSVVSLSIRRTDRGWPRDWRDFQRIKNDIAGPEVEAVELYPKESRLVDTANQFWLWCLPPGEEFPIGFTSERIVTGAEMAEQFGAGQREPDAEVVMSDPTQEGE